MATPDTAPAVVESVVDTTRAVTILEHVRQNNVSYLIGSLLLYQLGLLDKVVVWGSGCIA